MGNPMGESFSADTGAADAAAAMLGGGGTDPGSDTGGASQQGGNPAWQEFYQAVPEQYHEAVTPLLQKWDQGVNQRFNQVQSEYAPWNDVIKSGNTPDDVVLALNVLQTMVNNPREIYDALNAQYNFVDSTTGQQPSAGNVTPSANGQGQNEPDLQTAYDQRIAQMESNFQRLAQNQLSWLEQQEQAKEDQALDTELNNLRKKHGDFDEDYVLAKMYNGMNAEQAVAAYADFYRRATSQNMPRPLLLGSGGGAAPGIQRDPTKMTDKEAKDSALQLIMAMNNAQQQ